MVAMAAPAPADEGLQVFFAQGGAAEPVCQIGRADRRSAVDRMEGARRRHRDSSARGRRRERRRTDIWTTDDQRGGGASGSRVAQPILRLAPPHQATPLPNVLASRNTPAHFFHRQLCASLLLLRYSPRSADWGLLLQFLCAASGGSSRRGFSISISYPTVAPPLFHGPNANHGPRPAARLLHNTTSKQQAPRWTALGHQKRRRREGAMSGCWVAEGEMKGTITRPPGVSVGSED